MISITTDRCIAESSFYMIRKLPQFEATLMVMDEPKRKKFVRLEFKNRLYWADTITGILYDELTGKSLSSHLWIPPGQNVKLNKPAETKERGE